MILAYSNILGIYVSIESGFNYIVKKKNLTVEIKSEGVYFMTSIKGWYFWRMMDERESIMPEVLSFYTGHKV